jgi:hypothetical protein
MGNTYDSFGGSVLAGLAKYSAFNGQSKLQGSDLFVNAQQKFRFVVLLDDIPAAFISRVDRPSYTIETKEYNLLNHTVRYPVNVKWNQISLTIKEIFGGNSVGTVGHNLMNKLLAHSYYYPNEITNTGNISLLSAITNPLDTAREAVFGAKNLSKQNLNRALGEMKIVSLRPDGSTFETWTIYNGMITDLKFSDHSYSDEGLTDITITVQYDWAKLELAQP